MDRKIDKLTCFLNNIEFIKLRNFFVKSFMTKSYSWSHFSSTPKSHFFVISYQLVCFKFFSSFKYFRQILATDKRIVKRWIHWFCTISGMDNLICFSELSREIWKLRLKIGRQKLKGAFFCWRAFMLTLSFFEDGMKIIPSTKTFWTRFRKVRTKKSLDFSHDFCSISNTASICD